MCNFVTSCFLDLDTLFSLTSLTVPYDAPMSVKIPSITGYTVAAGRSPATTCIFIQQNLLTLSVSIDCKDHRLHCHLPALKVTHNLTL